MAKLRSTKKISYELSQYNSAEDEQNTSSEVTETSVSATRNSMYSRKVKGKHKSKTGYGKKLHHRSEASDMTRKTVEEETKKAQRRRVKKTIQKNAKKQKQAVSKMGKLAGKAVKKTKDVIKKMFDTMITLCMINPFFIFLFLILFLIIIGFVSCASSVELMGSGVGGVVIETSFTAEDDDIIAVNDKYLAMETEVEKLINSVKSDYPDYDEYQFSLGEICHNPYALAAMLTVMYENYTPSQVQDALATIITKQYEIKTERVVERRTRIVTKWHWVTKYRFEKKDGVIVQVPYQVYESYEEEEEYNYYILKVTMINHSVDSVVRQAFSGENLQRYEILLETYGNKKYLFEDDPYSVASNGEYSNYKVPAEYLTDIKFGNMLHEAEKYLGYPYVWGGSSPDTGFDCSGFVSYVLNNCGNGWNVGRRTADGLLHCCTSISAANVKPGDLIFFEKTHETEGASHVGIYVGDGMMLHCGNPVQYASINTAYWQSHFLTFGRLNQ